MTLSIKEKGKKWVLLYFTKNSQNSKTQSFRTDKLTNNRISDTNKSNLLGKEQLCVIHALQSILWEVSNDIDEHLPNYRMPKSLWQDPLSIQGVTTWSIRACYARGSYICEPIHFQVTGLHPSEVNKDFTIS